MRAQTNKIDVSFIIFVNELKQICLQMVKNSPARLQKVVSPALKCNEFLEIVSFEAKNYSSDNVAKWSNKKSKILASINIWKQNVKQGRPKFKKFNLPKSSTE